MSYLSRLPNARPVLQIIHVSDLHVLATKHPAARTVRFAERWAKRVGLNGLRRKLRDGTAPSGTFAPLVFRDFVERITVSDPTWSAYPTWLAAPANPVETEARWSQEVASTPRGARPTSSM